MKKLKNQAAELIVAAARAAFPSGEIPTAKEVAALLEYPPDSAMGDLAFPCFRLSRVLRNAPPKIAAALAEGIVAPQFAKVEAVGGYLNFFLIKTGYAQSIVEKVLEMAKELLQY